MSILKIQFLCIPIEQYFNCLIINQKQRLRFSTIDAVVDHCAWSLVDDLGKGFQVADEHVGQIFE